MLFAHATLFVCMFVALAHGAAVTQEKKKCHTIDSGFLSTFVGVNTTHGHNEALDLNSRKELTFESGKAVKAAFQACPELPSPSFSFAGRLVLQPTSSNMCLTITNPSSSSGPYFVKAEKCTSNVRPSAAQTWGFGNDFGNVIFYTGSKPCSDGAGVRLNEDKDESIHLGSRKRIELTCTSTSFESLTLTKKRNGN